MEPGAIPSIAPPAMAIPGFTIPGLPIAALSIPAMPVMPAIPEPERSSLRMAWGERKLKSEIITTNCWSAWARSRSDQITRGAASRCCSCMP